MGGSRFFVAEVGRNGWERRVDVERGSKKTPDDNFRMLRAMRTVTYTRLHSNPA